MKGTEGVASAPVLALIRDDEWPQSIAWMREGFAGRLNVYRMMAHNPALLAAWERLRNHIVLESQLTPAQSEIVILRTGWRWNSKYEWLHHVSRGRKVGLDDASIARCIEPSSPATALSGTELLIAAVDSLLDEGHLNPPLLALLTREIGTSAIMDLMATVGFYTTLAFLLETFDVPVDADVVAELGHDETVELSRLILGLPRGYVPRGS
jgi:alkylhydroperoxidase family enzyme